MNPRSRVKSLLVAALAAICGALALHNAFEVTFGTGTLGKRFSQLEFALSSYGIGHSRELAVIAEAALGVLFVLFALFVLRSEVLFHRLRSQETKMVDPR
jgi:hypothetical protein